MMLLTRKVVGSCVEPFNRSNQGGRGKWHSELHTQILIRDFRFRFDRLVCVEWIFIRVLWKIWKFQIENSTARFRTASQPWFQNSFWNYDWTIFLLRNWQNVRYKQTSKQTNKQKLKISISTTRLPTTSQSWFQNSFRNHDWTIFLLRNWQNVRFTYLRKSPI